MKLSHLNTSNSTTNIMDNFYEIREDSNPKLIDIVSELRHHINIWSISESLLKYFKTDFETIEKVYENAKGLTNVRNAISNIDAIIEEQQLEEDRRMKAELKNFKLLGIFI